MNIELSWQSSCSWHYKRAFFYFEIIIIWLLFIWVVNLEVNAIVVRFKSSVDIPISEKEDVQRFKKIVGLLLL